MKTGSVSDRRAFLKTAGYILSVSAFSGMPSLLRAQKAKEEKNEYDSLGEKFEREEDRLFGDEGFFKVVDTVAAIEKRLGIYDLAQFTPKVAP